MAASNENPAIKVVASNRRASHDYELFEHFECGLVLHGTEVKALRDAKCVLQDAFAMIDRGELWLMNCEISEYSHGNRMNHAPKQARKLLVKKTELKKIEQATRERGFTLVPLKIYFKGSWAKAEIAVARGLKRHDKRQVIGAKEAKRDIARALGRKMRGKG